MRHHEIFRYLGQLLGDQSLPLFIFTFYLMCDCSDVFCCICLLGKELASQYCCHTHLLLQLVREYDGVGIQVLLASPSTPLCESLKRHGFFKRYSSEHLFPTVGSAVRYAKDGNRVVSVWYL